MLTGKLVRVRHAKNRLVPQYLDPASDAWLDAADQVLFVYREAAGKTRGEVEGELAGVLGEGPQQLLFQGLAKLCEDRCEYEVTADLPPDSVREAAFRIAAVHRKAAGTTGGEFDRGAVLVQVADELGAAVPQVDQALFADLRDEQRILTFDDLTAEQLLHRYNVGLAQAILLRSVGMEVRVWAESPARFRQLFRAIRFHRLIATIAPAAGDGYLITLDGPLSLFSATQKYGMQLAMFLPTLLHCRAFDLRAEVRWGADRKTKAFTLSASDGLRSHTNDFGTYTPPEFEAFADSFRANVSDWLLSPDPHPVALPDGVWVPDFTLTHVKTGTEVFAELFGYWRRADIEKHYRRLRRHLPGKFVLVVSEAMRADDGDEFATGDEVYRYKRTPSAAAVAKAAAKVAGV